MKLGNMAGRYYYHHNNEVHGPVEFAELNNQVFSGFLEPSVFCCREGSSFWFPFHDICKTQSTPEITSGSPEFSAFVTQLKYENGRRAVSNAGTIFNVLSYLSFLVAGLFGLGAAIAAKESSNLAVPYGAIGLGFLIWGLLALFIVQALTALAFAVFDIAEQTAKR